MNRHRRRACCFWAAVLLGAAIALSGCHLIYPFDAVPVQADSRADFDLAYDASSHDVVSGDLSSNDAAPDGPAPTDDAAPDGPAQDGPAPMDMMPKPDQDVTVPSTWITIPKGNFQMGSPLTESCRLGGSEDQHLVILSNGFEISETEVTQGQFQSVMKYNPAAAVPLKTCTSAQCPVENVNWHEAVAYCNTLSTLATLPQCYNCLGGTVNVLCTVNSAYDMGKIYTCSGYRLPTDAEWEYAYRAGTNTAYHTGQNDKALCSFCGKVDPGADKIAWYCGNSSTRPHVVGTRQKNAWGLADMAGNVHEWCHDWYKPLLGVWTASDPWGLATGTLRVRRNASYKRTPRNLRAAVRIGVNPVTRSGETGFRCVRSK